MLTKPPSSRSASVRALPTALLLSALLCGIAMSGPFLAVTLPPITDLPQQVAQIRLLVDGAAEEGSGYRIQGWHPNKLGYLVLGALWPVSEPLDVGRRAVALIGWLWVAAVHLLAWRAGRGVVAAALASLLFFNHVTYWGLLNFVLGLPAFALFFLAVEGSPGRLPQRRALGLVASTLLLYSAHVLWLAGGLCWLVLCGWRDRWPARAWLERAFLLAPVGLLIALWYPSLVRGDFVSETVWGSLGTRLDPRWLVNCVLGGLDGRLEPMVAGALLLWLLAGLWQHRGGLRDAAHGGLLLASFVCWVLAFTLPSVHQGTVFFASRWVPMALVLTLLGSPAPRPRPAFLGVAFAAFLLLGASLTTAAAWARFEAEELEGLPRALEALPAGKRVLGLDLVRTSPRIKGFPFYHFYAYAQVAKGGGLNRSFANFPSSLVIFDDLPREHPWTYGLDWKASGLRQSDIPYFDYLIVHGEENAHALFGADPKLLPVTREARWRLYQVRAGSPGRG